MDSIALRPRGAPGFEREGGVVLVSGLIRMPKGVPQMTTTVKLSKLTLSPINVRRRPDDLLEIPQMAADLEARGVLQNLLVTPVKKPRGTFEVFDGGRRLRGLSLLAERGVIDADNYDVPVKVLVGDAETLSENSTAAHSQQPVGNSPGRGRLC